MKMSYSKGMVFPDLLRDVLTEASDGSGPSYLRRAVAYARGRTCRLSQSARVGSVGNESRRRTVSRRVLLASTGEAGHMAVSFGNEEKSSRAPNVGGAG